MGHITIRMGIDIRGIGIEICRMGHRVLITMPMEIRIRESG